MSRLPLIALVINALALPLGCVPIVFLLNAFNPMQLAFITEFTVENRTGEPIWITPIGSVGRAGDRWPLATSSRSSPWMESPQRGRLPIADGATLRLHYDWDDIRFTELVVEIDGAPPRQLVVEPDQGAGGYKPPEVPTFVIDDWDQLDPVDPAVLAAYERALEPSHLRRTLAPLALPMVTIVPVLVWYLRSRPRRTPPPPTPLPTPA